jgi:ATP-dependent Clp protease ATP-binding subunit ClpA
MPAEAELPEAIKGLSYRHAIAVRDDPDFHHDISRLIGSMSSLVDRTASSEGNIPKKKEDGSAQSRLMTYSIQEIEEQLKRRLFGQQDAIRQVMPWIKRLRFGLLREDKAAATFLFVGESGLGKTVLAKELARVVCGDEERLLRFESTLLQGAAANEMLIGAQPGHMGYGEGKLVNALRDAPASVLFFEQIEKAGPEVGDLLRRFLDSGFIRDGAGPIRDGREAVVILSTSLRPSQSSQKQSPDEVIQATIKSVRTRFSPEFLAPVDEIVCFLPFSRDACRQIADLAIDRDVLKLSQARGIHLVVEESARELIAAEFHKLSLSQGARAASGVVHRLLIVPLIDYVFNQASDALGSDNKILHATFDGKSEIVIRPGK